MKKHYEVRWRVTQIMSWTRFAVFALVLLCICSYSRDSKGSTLTVEAPVPEISDQKEASAWRSAESQDTIEAYQTFLDKFPDSIRKDDAQFALGTLFVVDKSYDEAINHYMNYAKSNLSDTLSHYTVQVAKLEKEGKSATSVYHALLKGDLRPIEGSFGLVLPVEDAFFVNGSTTSHLYNEEFTARITNTEILYSDPGKTKTVGWGVVVTSGEVILPMSEYNTLQNNKISYFIDNHFDVEPLDYLGKYMHLTISSKKHQRFIIPVFIFSKINTGTSNLVPGSVYNIRAAAKDVRSGFSSNLLLGDLTNKIDLYTVFYRIDNGKNSAGLRIGKKGEKIIYGAQNLLFTATEQSFIDGIVNFSRFEQ